MDELQLRLVEALRHAAERFRKAGLPGHLSSQAEQLASDVVEPCVVAVVGRVKAGKSTFVNALLGEDLARMGATETTATINYFRYGTPDPAFPVRCYWRTGKRKVTDENRAFLDSLQGKDQETLRRAADIDHLEYLVPNRYLEQITLVDTPGTGAAVAEHERRVTEFANVTDPLYEDLMKRHHDETLRLGSTADAVIYLIGGVTARVADETFLKQFLEATGDTSRAYNALGVMAQIDLNEQVVKRREELSEKIASQLQHRLNTVIPISAGIQRTLNSLLAENQQGLQELVRVFRRTPPLSTAVVENLFSDSQAYDEYEDIFKEPCPVTPEERKQVRGKRGKNGEPDEIPWTVFTTIVRTVLDTSLADETAIVRTLQAIAGFERLHTVLEYHFVRRGRLLRSYNVVNKALKLLEEMRDTYLREFYRQEARNQERRDRFLAFLRRTLDSPVAQELEVFIQERLAPRADMAGMLDELEREMIHFKYELEDYNADFKALQDLQEHRELFSEQELQELQPLFGFRSLESEKRLQPSQVTCLYIEERQAYWEVKSGFGRDPVVIAVAKQAVRSYGLIAEELIDGPK